MLFERDFVESISLLTCDSSPARQVILTLLGSLILHRIHLVSQAVSTIRLNDLVLGLRYHIIFLYI